MKIRKLKNKQPLLIGRVGVSRMPNVVDKR